MPRYSLSLHAHLLETRPAVALSSNAASNDSAERRSALDAVGGYGNHALHSSGQSYWPLGRPAVANQLSAVRSGRVRRGRRRRARIGDSSWLSRAFQEGPRSFVLSCVSAALCNRKAKRRGAGELSEEREQCTRYMGVEVKYRFAPFGRRFLHAE